MSEEQDERAAHRQAEQARLNRVAVLEEALEVEQTRVRALVALAAAVLSWEERHGPTGPFVDMLVPGPEWARWLALAGVKP